MEKIVKIVSYIFLFLLLVSLVPYVILCYYNHPAADDFCNYNRFKNTSLFDFFCTYYFTWTGRYTQIFFEYVANAIGLLKAVKIIPFLLLLGLYYSLLILVKIKLIFLKTFEANILTALILFLYLANMPSLSQGIYWLAASSTYLVSCILVNLLFYYIELFKISPKASKLVAIIAVTIFLVGSNENILLFVVGGLFLNTIYFFFFKKEFVFKYFIIFIVSLVFAAASIFAPGNFARLKSETNSAVQNVGVIKLPFYKVFWFSLNKPFEILITNSIAFIFLLFVIFLIFNSKKILFHKEPSSFKSKLYNILALLALSSLIAFPSFWAMGVFFARSSNVLFWILHIIVLFFSIDFYPFISYHLVNRTKLLLIAVFCMGIVTFLSLIVKNSNWKVACYDVVSGRAKKYGQAFDDRYKLLEKGKDLVVPPLKMIAPSLFVGEDIKEYHNYWTNDCMATFFELKSIRIDH